jgi:hypothetical protein
MSGLADVTFDVASQLLPNLIEWNGDDVGPILSWSISDGVNTLWSQNPNDFIDLGVATDASGKITSWDALSMSLQTPFLWLETVNPPSCCGIDLSEAHGNPNMAPTAFASADTPGPWSVSPEPVTWPVVALALLGILFWKRQTRLTLFVPEHSISARRRPRKPRT